MEKRALIAIGLAVALLLAWQVFVSPPSPPPGRTGPGGAGALPGPSGDAGPARAAGVPAKGAAAPVTATRPLLPGGVAAGGPAAEGTTPLYEVTFAPDGSGRSRVLLSRGKKPLRGGPDPAPLAVAIALPGRPSEVVPLRADTDRLELTAERPTGAVVFTGVTPTGSRVEKRVRFDATSYRIEVELQ